MADEKAHLAAVVALLETAGAAPKTMQDLADLDMPPSYYTEVTVSQMLGDGPRRTDEPSERTQWRILTRAVGERYANAQLMRVRASVLHLSTLTVGTETFHIERALSDDPIGPDDGWFSGTSEFTY